MTANEYRAAIEQLGLSQLSAAKFLGVSDRQSRRFALAEADIPAHIAKLLRLMIRLKITPDEVD